MLLEDTGPAPTTYRALLWKYKFQVLTFFGLIAAMIWYVGWNNYVWMWRLTFPVVAFLLVIRVAYYFYSKDEAPQEDGFFDGGGGQAI